MLEIFKYAVDYDFFNTHLKCTLSFKEWLARSAKLISSAGKPVQWITPLGLPVVQPYYKPVKNLVCYVVKCIYFIGFLSRLKLDFKLL